MSEWQPIETCPEDREEVLVCTRDQEIHIAWTFEGGWFNESSEFLPGVLTHWMPLPEPPE